METLRLDKLLSTQGICSRKEAGPLVRAGVVQVNGSPAKRADQKVSYQDEIMVAGRKLLAQQYIYIMLHKPLGVVSASRDTTAQTVVDLVPQNYQRPGLFPAGRLDKDTTGFVLITDDGSFAHTILTPKNHIPKTYLVTLDKPLSPQVIEAFGAGVQLGDGTACKPAQLAILAPQQAQVILHQGMYHQIKRMFAAQGFTVTALHRSAMGNIPLDATLQPGQCRLLTPAEIAQIGG